jgi:hypothetical protein
MFNMKQNKAMSFKTTQVSIIKENKQEDEN